MTLEVVYLQRHVHLVILNECISQAPRPLNRGKINQRRDGPISIGQQQAKDVGAGQIRLRKLHTVKEVRKLHIPVYIVNIHEESHNLLVVQPAVVEHKLGVTSQTANSCQDEMLVNGTDIKSEERRESIAKKQTNTATARLVSLQIQQRHAEGDARGLLKEKLPSDLAHRDERNVLHGVNHYGGGDH